MKTLTTPLSKMPGWTGEIWVADRLVACLRLTDDVDDPPPEGTGG